MVVFTTVYEGQTILEFVQMLSQRGVELLVDVRELPLSRKKGFSKSKLAGVLKEHGIDYLHLRELGSPRTLRQELRQQGDYEHFFRNTHIT